MTGITFNGESNLQIVTARYECNDRLAVDLEADGEPYICVSINLPDEQIAEGEFAVKTYSKNTGMMEAQQAANAIEFTGRYTNELRLPICRLR